MSFTLMPEAYMQYMKDNDIDNVILKSHDMYPEYENKDRCFVFTDEITINPNAYQNLLREVFESKKTQIADGKLWQVQLLFIYINESENLLIYIDCGDGSDGIFKKLNMPDWVFNLTDTMH